jgi:hypothetical protein
LRRLAVTSPVSRSARDLSRSAWTPVWLSQYQRLGSWNSWSGSPVRPVVNVESSRQSFAAFLHLLRLEPRKANRRKVAVSKRTRKGGRPNTNRPAQAEKRSAPGPTPRLPNLGVEPQRVQQLASRDRRPGKDTRRCQCPSGKRAKAFVA